MKTCFRCTPACTSDRTGITLNRYHLSGPTYDPGHEHSHIPDPGAKL
jgi:hypothetical protein